MKLILTCFCVTTFYGGWEEIANIRSPVGDYFSLSTQRGICDTFARWEYFLFKELQDYTLPYFSYGLKIVLDERGRNSIFSSK